MIKDNKCPICKLQEIDNVEEAHDYVNAKHIKCNWCGEYKIKKAALSMSKSISFGFLPSLWIYNQNLNGDIPKIDESNINELKEIKNKSTTNKYELLIRFFYKNENSFFKEGGTREDNKDLIRFTWCKNSKECKLLLNKAVKDGFLNQKEISIYSLNYEITFDGKVFVEDLTTDINSNKIFMAFHFTNEMKEQFEKTVKKAVVDSSNGKLIAERVSGSQVDHDTKIDDELIGMIKSSKAVIADFTGNRTAVYYEAGFAMGLGIPVIWTCRDTDIDDLSFDTRQYPHIIWKDEKDLYKQIVNRLKAKIL